MLAKKLHNAFCQAFKHIWAIYLLLPQKVNSVNNKKLLSCKTSYQFLFKLPNKIALMHL